MIIKLTAAEDEYWTISCLNYKGCHTQGKDIHDAMENLGEALTLFVGQEECIPDDDILREENPKPNLNDAIGRLRGINDDLTPQIEELQRRNRKSGEGL